MTERELIDQQIRTFMDSLWERGDPWDIESSPMSAIGVCTCSRCLKADAMHVCWRSAAVQAI